MKLIINDIIFEIDYEIKPTANLIIKSISTDGDIRSLLRDDVKNAIDALLPELIYDRLMEGL